MSKLKIIPSSIENEIIPSIDNGKMYLNNAVNILSSSPEQSRCNVGATISSINDVIADLNELSNWCSESIAAFKNLDKKYEDNAYTLSCETMKLRNNKIN